MLVGTWFLLSAFAAVYVTLSKFTSGISWIENVFGAIPISMVVSSWFAMAVALVFGTLDYKAVLISSIFFTAITIAVVKLWPSTSLSSRKLPDLPFFIYLAVYSGFAAHMAYTHSLRKDKNGELHSAGSTWGDLPFHLNLISSFVNGVNKDLPLWKFEAIIYSGNPMVYPLICDYHSALLVVGGFHLGGSIGVPQFLLLLSFTVLQYFMAKRITGSSSSLLGISATLLSLCSGGMAWWHDSFFSDWWKSGKGLFNFLEHNSKNFVYYTKWGNPFWFQTVCDILLPQRAALMAYPINIYMISILWEALNPARRPDSAAVNHDSFSYSSSSRRMCFLIAGIVAGLLPFCQGHAFVATCILSGALFLSHLRLALFDLRPYIAARTKANDGDSAGSQKLWQMRNLVPIWVYIETWLFFFVPLGLLGFPQMWFLSERARSWGLLHWDPIWPHEKGTTPVSLWYDALGFFVPMAIIAVLGLTPRQLRFNGAFWVVFLAGNVIKWQPWKVDNCKILQLWHWASSAAIASLFTSMNKTQWRSLKILALLIFITLTLSGALCIGKESKMSWSMFTPKDLQLAEFVKRNTDRRAVFLIADEHNHPIPCLTGRPVLMGYRGWLDSHGYRYGQDGRERDAMSMFSGAWNAVPLMRKYNISFVAVPLAGSPDRNFGAKLAAFSGRYPVAFRHPHMTLFNVTGDQ